MQETQDSIPGSGKFPRVGNGNPLQYSCLENSMNKGAGGPQSMGSQKSDLTVHTPAQGLEWIDRNSEFSQKVPQQSIKKGFLTLKPLSTLGFLILPGVSVNFSQLLCFSADLCKVCSLCNLQWPDTREKVWLEGSQLFPLCAFSFFSKIPPNYQVLISANVVSLKLLIIKFLLYLYDTFSFCFWCLLTSFFLFSILF